MELRRRTSVPLDGENGGATGIVAAAAAAAAKKSCITKALALALAVFLMVEMPITTFRVSAFSFTTTTTTTTTTLSSAKRKNVNVWISRYRSSSSSSSSNVLIVRKATNLPDSVFETIDQGGIAVVENFFSQSQVSQLREDARKLYKEGYFITDALAGYGNKAAAARDKAKFDPSKDRSVLPAYIPSKQTLGPFVSPTLGDANLRQDFITSSIAMLRKEMSIGLDRPGMYALPDGMNNHEISYTRFGPGAYLKRHNDEHHEELKGIQGWKKPTRRSLSWLVYLNEADWDASRDGGNLRTYPRIAKPSDRVGSRNGDLQIGWLRSTRDDPIERPVFLDGRRQGESGNCALYIDSPNNNKNNNYTGRQKLYLTKDFKADPYLFVSSDWVVQHVLIGNSDLGSRFHYVEPPKSLLTEYWEKQHAGESFDKGEYVLDVAPTGGTLVMFDSVALPHEVMSTAERERWATSGWFHEAQQEIPKLQQLFIIS